MADKIKAVRLALIDHDLELALRRLDEIEHALAISSLAIKGAINQAHADLESAIRIANQITSREN